MSARPDVKDVARFCEERQGRVGGISTVVFPGGSRAKFDANVVELAGPLIELATARWEWKQCDVCDRMVAADYLQAYEEGDACVRCCEWGT
jgi:hypothetical protein